MKTKKDKRLDVEKAVCDDCDLEIYPDAWGRIHGWSPGLSHNKSRGWHHHGMSYCLRALKERLAQYLTPPR